VVSVTVMSANKESTNVLDEAFRKTTDEPVNAQLTQQQLQQHLTILHDKQQRFEAMMSGRQQHLETLTVAIQQRQLGFDTMLAGFGQTLSILQSSCDSLVKLMTGPEQRSANKAADNPVPALSISKETPKSHRQETMNPDKEPANETAAKSHVKNTKTKRKTCDATGNHYAVTMSHETKAKKAKPLQKGLYGGGKLEMLSMHQGHPRQAIQESITARILPQSQGLFSFNCFLFSSCCDPRKCTFLQYKKQLHSVDLSNASAVIISYDVAQNFIVNGVPTAAELNRIIELSAPKIFFVRDQLRQKEYCANIDLGELFTCLSSLRDEQPKLFRERFPQHDAEPGAFFTVFHGSIVYENDLEKFQGRIEDRCKTHNRYALSFWFKGQAASK
jgi:hypothetical protein